jgi:hypothetical protein
VATHPKTAQPAQAHKKNGRPRNNPGELAKETEAYRMRHNQRSRERRANTAINFMTNERRRERAWRFAQGRQEANLKTIIRVFGTGRHVASVVSEYDLLRDRTRFSGPGRARAAAMERETEAFLQAATRANHNADFDKIRQTPPPPLSHSAHG